MPSPQTITERREGRFGCRPGRPYLFLTLRCDEPLAPGARFALNGVETVSIGRARSLEVERRDEDGAKVLRIGVPDSRMSARHARIYRAAGSWIVADEGSKNGTLLDGDRATSTSVRDGALLELGRSFFIF